MSLAMELQSELQVLSKLSLAEQKALLAEIQRRKRYSDGRRRLWSYYPDAGPLRRELYPRHLDFFANGSWAMQRAFIAANRTGKTTAAGYELACHLTGEYPAWWVGRRFGRAVHAWAAGVDIKAVRGSLQEILFGKSDELGTGLIPGDSIVGTPTTGRGVADTIDTARIRHKSGGTSSLTLKTYEQGRESFQAAKIDIGWCDEEPPQPVYSEFLTRLMSTVPGEPNGIMMCTFTPLLGVSEVVQYFLGDDWAPPVDEVDDREDVKPNG